MGGGLGIAVGEAVVIRRLRIRLDGVLIGSSSVDAEMESMRRFLLRGGVVSDVGLKLSVRVVAVGGVGLGELAWPRAC